MFCIDCGGMAGTGCIEHSQIPSPEIEPLLKLDEAAKIIRRSSWTIRKYVAAGTIKCVRIGRDCLIEPAELRTFIESRRTQ